MPSKAPVITIEEKSGDKYPDLESAQETALPELAFSLADMLRRMIESGALESKDGHIVPKGSGHD